MCTRVKYPASGRLTALLGNADLSLFAFFSVVYCLTWSMVLAEQMKRGEGWEGGKRGEREL